MSTDLKPLVTAEQCDAGWIALRGGIVQREGYVLRAAGHRIEIKMLDGSERWLALALPGGGINFATIAERDAVLAALRNVRDELTAHPAPEHK